LRHVLPKLSADHILVLHVGRVRPLKNQLLLAEAVAKLDSRFQLLLAGPVYSVNDSYAASVRRRLAQADLLDRAAFIDSAVPEVEELMKAADIFAFPSTQEGLGTVMIEALACGLPVVASRLPGVTDWVVVEGENGYFSAFDPHELAEQIARAASLLPARQGIAAAAAAKFDQRLMDDGYRRLFNRVLMHD
jgi:glycosyltransferase involved in cell wall biosynthesis